MIARTYFGRVRLDDHDFLGSLNDGSLGELESDRDSAKLNSIALGPGDIINVHLEVHKPANDKVEL